MSKKIVTCLVVIVLLRGAGLLLTQHTLAQQSGSPTGASISLKNPISCVGNTPGSSGVECVVGKIITALNVLAIPIVTLMLLIGGFQFMTAGGDPKRVEAGKKTLLWTVVGYAVIFMANAVVLIIKSVLGSAN